MRLTAFRLVPLILAASIVSSPLMAQNIISAKSGLIHYTEGDVKIGDQAAGPNNSVFQSLANGQQLRTLEGRAEMLLGPGQFVRLNEHTAIQMISNKLDSTRFDVIAGSVIIELVDISKGAPITVGIGTQIVELRKAGLYRIDAAESRLRVIEGEAQVQANKQSIIAKKGRNIELGAVLAESDFDSSLVGDEFSRWTERRAGYVATANISGAREAYQQGWQASNWIYNPWYGMYTFVPHRKFNMSPFGFYYFSPEFAFNDLFWPYLDYGNGYGYGFYGSGMNCYNGLQVYYGCGGYSQGFMSNGGSLYNGGGSAPRTGPRYPTAPRGGTFGPRGYGTGISSGGGSSPSMTRGGGGSRYNGDSGGSVRGGYSAGSGHSGGGVSYSGGGGHSTGSVSSGGSSGSSGTTTGGAASSGGASAGGKSK